MVSTYIYLPSCLLCAPRMCQVTDVCLLSHSPVCGSTLLPTPFSAWGRAHGATAPFPASGHISYSPRVPTSCPSQLAPTMFTEAAHTPRYFHPLPAAPHTAHIALLDDGCLVIFFFRRDSHMLAVYLQNAFLKTESKGSPAPRKLFHHLVM